MSNVQGPADQPLFDPPAIRGSHKIYSAAGAGGAGGGSESWSHAETVNPSASEFGGPCVFPFAVRLYALYLSLVNASNVALTVNTVINGGVASVNTLPVGSTLTKFTLNLSVPADQRLYPVLLAAATGTGYGLGVTYWYDLA